MSTQYKTADQLKVGDRLWTVSVGSSINRTLFTEHEITKLETKGDKIHMDTKSVSGHLYVYEMPISMSPTDSNNKAVEIIRGVFTTRDEAQDVLTEWFSTPE